MARALKKSIPMTIVAGPRGAGKTTLINRLLDTQAFANTAVILNDFGEVALKSALVKKAEDGFIALGSGCVCCTVRGALADGLERLLHDLDNGRIAAINRVVIEADEAADPAAILAAVARHPYLSLRFAPDGIVAVLDASTALATLAARADTARQAAMADVIALSRFAPIGDVLAALNPQAAIVDAAEVAPAAIVGHGAFDAASGDIEAWLGAGHAGNSAGLSGEAARVNAFSVARIGVIPIAALDRFLDYLAALQGANLIRVRGAVATGEGEVVVVESFGGFFHPPLIVDRPGGAPPTTRLAVVARDLDRALFERYLDAFLNEARVDTPDREALTANPLAIAGFSARSGR
jgi:G3E family GTPase